MTSYGLTVLVEPASILLQSLKMGRNTRYKISTSEITLAKDVLVVTKTTHTCFSLTSKSATLCNSSCAIFCVAVKMLS